MTFRPGKFQTDTLAPPDALNPRRPFGSIPVPCCVGYPDMKKTGTVLAVLLALSLALSQCTPTRPIPPPRPSEPPVPSAAALPAPEILDRLNASLDRA